MPGKRQTPESEKTKTTLKRLAVISALITLLGGIATTYHDVVLKMVEGPHPIEKGPTDPPLERVPPVPRTDPAPPATRHKVTLTIPTDIRASARFTSDGRTAQVDWSLGWVAFHLPAGPHILQAEDDSQVCTARVVVPSADEVVNSDCQPRGGH